MLLAGTAILTGDGTTKNFNIVTGLSYVPTLVQLTAGSKSAVTTSAGTVINSFYVDTTNFVDGTIPVAFVNAPDSGSFTLYWTVS